MKILFQVHFKIQFQGAKVKIQFNMKLLSVFMVILVAGVSVQCANVHPALQQNQIQNQRYFDLISGIASVIGQLIEQTNQAIENFRTQILQQITDRLQAFEVYLSASANAFQNYVLNVQAQIDVLINGRIKPCLSGIPDNIKTANHKTRQDINECLDNGKAQLALVGEGVEQYRIGTRQEIEKSQKKIDECVQEPNFGNKIICAIEAVIYLKFKIINTRFNNLYIYLFHSLE